MVAVPKNLGTISDIKSRENKAFQKMANWEDILDDVYEYFLPNRNLFNREVQGSKKMDRIFDSTALESIQQAASKLQSIIAPIWVRWANFEPSSKILRLLKAPEASEQGISETDIRENMEDIAEQTFDFINRSNFATQFYEFALDVLVGTGTMQVDEGETDEFPLIFSSIPQIGLAYEEGPNGNIETHWRRFKVKARNIERRWPGFEVSTELAAIIKDSPDADVQINQGLVFDPKDNIYWGVVWVKSEDKLSWTEDFQDSSPMITARYSKTAGEVRGRGPALQALPDAKSLNKIKEFVLQKAAIDLAGMWTSTDDGITNPYSMVIAPGVVIPVGSNQTNNPSLTRLDTTNNLNLALFEVTELQDAIKKALFNDMREPSDSVVSASQFLFEQRSLANRIGSAYGRLQSEALIPMLKRVNFILTRRGLIQDLKIGGEDVAIKFTSPLARAQDAEDILNVEEAVAFTVRTAGPDQAKMAFKLEDMGTWVAEKSGMPQELVRNPTEKKIVIQAGADAVKEGLAVGAPQQQQVAQ